MALVKVSANSTLKTLLSKIQGVINENTNTLNLKGINYECNKTKITELNGFALALSEAKQDLEKLEKYIKTLPVKTSMGETKPRIYKELKLEEKQILEADAVLKEFTQSFNQAQTRILKALGNKTAKEGKLTDYKSITLNNRKIDLETINIQTKIAIVKAFEANIEEYKVEGEKWGFETFAEELSDSND